MFERWFFLLGGGAEERRVVPLLVGGVGEMGLRGDGGPWIGNCLAPLQRWLPENEIGRFLIAHSHSSQHQ